MAAPFKQTLQTNASLPPNSYIYNIISTGPRESPLRYGAPDQLAIISSDDSLRFLNPTTLDVLPDGIIKNANEKVTCLERTNDAASNVIATAGRDGFIRFWDKRSRQKALEVQSPHKLISSLICDATTNLLACGTENPDDGPSSSPVYIFDPRNASAPTRSYVDSHTDTVTSLALHPSHPTLLLSASTDGLINIFDTTQTDEDDALYQVVNHGSAIAHAGFMLSSTDMYALGTDETAGFYALQSNREEVLEPKPHVLGDVRERLGCEYVVKMHWVGAQACIAVGKHSAQSLDIIPISRAGNEPLDYVVEAENAIASSWNTGSNLHFPGAHGEEIVRDIYSDIITGVTYTCGEDGMVRAWGGHFDMEGMDGMDVDEGAGAKKKGKERKEKRKEKKEKEKARYKPY